ncbi:MAG: ATP-binding cassette domain-containing protein [Myxococcota bacterium]
MSENLIQVENLTKHYGSVRAVDGISFDVKSSQVVGFLGPNGAGKSTTMKILSCYIGPTGGRARVAGFDVLEKPLEARRRIGYLPENNPIYDDMTALEYLEFVAAVRDIPSATRAARLSEISTLCGLEGVLGKPVGELSKGFRQRLGLAQAMAHDPDILLMDEPTSGLDPNQIVEIRSLIREIGQRKTVILSTHILPEVQATCDRAIIIHEGKIVADGTLEELRRREQGNRYRVVVEGPTPDEARDRVRSLEGVLGIEASSSDGACTLEVTASAEGDLRRPIFRLAVDRGWTLLELRRDAATLEDVFRKLTRE